MEHLKGSVKQEIIKKKNLSEMEAMNYFTQAAEGLVYLHSRKPKAIIHRDIKCKATYTHYQPVLDYRAIE